MLSFNRLERAEFVACIGITSCHWYLHLISSEERAKLIHFKWKTCWLVTSNLVRTCRSWFEMESLEMKKNSGDILKPVKTRPQYKRIWKEIWQVSVDDVEFGNSSEGAVWKMWAWRAHGLRLSTFSIGCHGNTLLLPDVSSTEAFDRFLRLMICTFLHSEQIRWFTGCYWTSIRGLLSLGELYPSPAASVWQLNQSL